MDRLEHKQQEDKMTQRVTILGSGGIAGLYGALLHRAGWSIDMVARSDWQVIRDKGLTVNSLLGDLSFRPKAVYASVDEAAQQGAADWLLLAVKILPEVDLASQIKPLVGPNTTIVLIANGIDIETPLVEAFPRNSLVSCVTYVGTSRSQPGVIEHESAARLFAGNYPQGADAHCTTWVEALTQAGSRAKMTDNIQRERWTKSVWNASFNPLSVVTNGADTDTMLGTPEAEGLVRAVMEEVVTTAAADGHSLDSSVIESNLAHTRKMSHYRTSMALDYLNGRALELDAIVGRIVAIADGHGVAIPHLRTIYDILRMRAE